jgi:hypothetical protein
LVGVVLELDHFVQVVGSGLLFYVFLNEIPQLHVIDAERVVGMEESPAALIRRNERILSY